MQLPHDNKLSTLLERYHQSLDEKLGSSEVNSIFTLLVYYFLGWEKSEYHLQKNAPLSESELLKFHFALKDLLKNKPVQYIIGETEFCNLRIKVNENVLIPRPETEELVYLIRQYCKDHNLSPSSIIDLCSGSGCIALGLQKFFPGAIVKGAELLEGAVKVAEENASLNFLPVDFYQLDLLLTEPESAAEFLNITSSSVDIIASNPPYISRGEMSLMNDNVLSYEPHIALFADEKDVLVFYRRIAVYGNFFLTKGGIIAVEINEHFGEETKKVFEEAGFNSVELIQDMQSKNRFVIALRG